MKLRIPKFTTPTAPDISYTDASIPYVGPYAQAQALAQQAYENAMAQTNSQRALTMQQYGFMPDANGNLVIDPSNRFGQVQQTMLTNQQEADSLEQGALNRGFHGAGFAQQGANAGRLAEQARMFNVGQGALNQLTNLSQQAAQSQWTLDNSALTNKMNSVQYALDHNMFTPGAPQRSQATVDSRIQQMARAWAQRYGARSLNKAGMTFQQRLDKIGAANLYNPTAHYSVGGKRF